MISKVLRSDKPTAVSRCVGGNEQRRDTAKQTARTHEGKQETVYLFVFHQEENCDKDKLNGAKMEGQIRFGEYATKFVFVGVGVIEDFNSFGNETAIEEHGNEETEIFLSYPQEKRNDKQYGYAYKNKMAKAE